MPGKSNKTSQKLHPRNKHQGRYDFAALTTSNPALKSHIKPNRMGEDSIDFANPDSVKILNQSLLKHQYKINNWEIPEGYLCPAIPGRAEYIHHMADWLATNNFGRIPNGEKITCLDIGVGSSLIYPIIGISDYGWYFIGSDVDPTSLESARNIAESNDSLNGKIELRIQSSKRDILYGILTHEERVDLVICNPPFHSSAEEANAGSERKVRNLTGKKNVNVKLNFAGQPNELWYDGGERAFIHNYIRQSKKFKNSCFWFSSLVSRQSNLKSIYAALTHAGAVKSHTIPMGHGNKSSRIVTWTFLSPKEQAEWKKKWSKLNTAV